MVWEASPKQLMTKFVDALVLHFCLRKKQKMFCCVKVPNFSEIKFKSFKTKKKCFV